ncbi:MAG: hypothetical protein AVDCRST_MAG42-1290, partial [uncultured Chthoniobacterales bacterium]
ARLRFGFPFRHGGVVPWRDAAVRHRTVLSAGGRRRTRISARLV